MSFSYTLNTDIGKVRLKLADSGGAAPGGTSTTYAFEDEEITAFLTEGGSVDSAVALGLKALLVDAARREKAFKLPGLDYDDKGRVASLKVALSFYGSALPTATVHCPTLDMDRGFVDPIPTVR